MSHYIWIYRGEKRIVPEQLLCILQENNWDAVCLCKKELLEEGKDTDEVTFDEIFLDERHLEYGLVLKCELLREAGGINMRISAKRDYELALRVVQRAKVRVMTYDAFSFEEEQNNESTDAGFITDAYVVGRYYSVLQSKGIAELVLNAVLEESRLCEFPQKAQQFLEQMLAHTGEYQRLYRATQPILIYLGVTYCYNILNVFAKELASALEELGECVEFYDTEKDDVGELSRLINQQYKASIGFQTWVMTVRMGENRGYVQDMIGGPKFDFVVDHPIWLKDQLERVPGQFYVLTHDRDYQQFVRKYFPKVKEAYLLPPGGRCLGGDADGQFETDELKQCDGEQKEIVFLGTYGDYRRKLQVIRAWSPRMRHFAARYLGVMKRKPNLTAEEAFRETLQYYEMELDEAVFLDLFYNMMTAVQTIMYYYREKVVQTILLSGLELHVYGDSWKDSLLSRDAGLQIHPAVSGEQGMEVLKFAKVSLNVMAWHKDGFTERIADSMLSGAVVVSDKSRRLIEDFSEETILFDLTKLEEVPAMLRQLLRDEARRKAIAEKAKKKALASETWRLRALEFLKIIEEAEG